MIDSNEMQKLLAACGHEYSVNYEPPLDGTLREFLTIDVPKWSVKFNFERTWHERNDYEAESEPDNDVLHAVWDEDMNEVDHRDVTEYLNSLKPSLLDSLLSE